MILYRKQTYFPNLTEIDIVYGKGNVYVVMLVGFRQIVA